MKCVSIEFQTSFQRVSNEIENQLIFAKCVYFRRVLFASAVTYGVRLRKYRSGVFTQEGFFLVNTFA